MLWTVEKKIAMGFGFTLAILLVVGVVSYRNTRKLIRDSNAVAHSHDVQDELDNTLSTIVEAETGQRGFLLTGEDSYLAPYREAKAQVDAQLSELGHLVQNDPPQRVRFLALRNPGARGPPGRRASNTRCASPPARR